MPRPASKFSFAAAHRLPRYSGKCFNLHGHNYRFQVVVRGEPDPYTGIFVDFSDVEKLVKEHVLDRVDHTNLNDSIENPTAENIATWMWQHLEGKLPGLVESMEPDRPGMHGTDSIDYGIVLSGEILLELDDGATVHLEPGDCVVQQGTRHAWRNHTSQPCTMAFVLVGARRG